MSHHLLNYFFSGFMSDSIGIFLLRTVTGILFFFQGYDKLFNIKISNVARTFQEPLNKIHIPKLFLKPLIGISSFIEFVCGILLMIGLFKCIALYFLSFNLILIAFIFSSVRPMWDMQYFFPRMIFILILLFTSMVLDPFSLDALFHLN